MAPKKNKNKKKGGGGGGQTVSAAFDYEEEEAVDIAEEETPADLKVRGNEAVKAGEHGKAVKLFSAAIERGPPSEELHLYHSNRSVAALSVKKYALAVADAEKCVSLKPDWGKGYSRLGAAHFYAEHHQAAITAYTSGLEIEPSNATLAEGLAAAKAAAAAAASPPPGAPTAKKEATSPGKEKMGGGDKKENGKAKADGGGGGKGPVIGIDLGTTYSCVAVCAPGQGRVEIITNADGSRTTPSWVAFSQKEGTRLVGQAAKNQAAANTANTVNDAKRLIGRPWHDTGLQKDLAHLSYTVKENDGRPQISLSCECWEQPRAYLPEQISAMVLEQLKKDAEAFLGTPVHRAVITVPAHFNDAQRQATKDAGRIAGLEVLRMINEPTAAALAYGLDNATEKDTTVLVFDLGGGTFDVSILSMEGGIFEVKATGGNTRLGGEDFDANVVGFLLQGFKKAHKGATISERAMRRLYAAAERAKRQLSAATQAEVEVEAFADGHDLKVVLTRAKFESLNQPQFDSCLDCVKAVLKDAALAKGKIDEVVLVGGSTRIPKIRTMLTDFFDGKPLCASINPDEAVAYGAAVQAGVLGGGLAAAGGALAKAATDLVLMDVVPLSLGIETTGKNMSVVVKRNTPIPCRKTDTFTTEEDNQTEVDIAVFEGERASTDACNELGMFTISGIARGKRGEAEILVTFDLDANGILSVSATDKATGAKNQIVITSTTQRNTKDDVDRMVADGERFAAEDAKLQKKAEARRECEDAIFDLADDEAAPEKARDAAELAEEWLQSNFERLSVDEIRAKATELRGLARG